VQGLIVEKHGQEVESQVLPNERMHSFIEFESDSAKK